MKYRTLAIVLTIIVALGVVIFMILEEYTNVIESEQREITKAQGIEELPDSYYDPAPLGGTLEVIEYEASMQTDILEEKTVSGKYASNGSKPPEGAEKEDLAKSYTFKDDSKDGENDGVVLDKKATVYLPYGYDPKEEYDILYLVHGRGGDYRTWLGTPGSSRPFKNILDNMILNGDIEPLIVVCPSLTYEYKLDDRIMDGMSHEISHELITAVESEYSTYAEDANPEDFEASRDHRGMAGFSMGGSVTWHVMKDHVDYFKCFMPMSMALYFDRNGYSESKNKLAVDALEDSIKEAGYTSEDVYVYAATGTADHKAEAIAGQVGALSERTDIFNYTDGNFSKGNIMFRCWPDKWHRYTEAFPYIYDGLKNFYK